MYEPRILVIRGFSKNKTQLSSQAQICLRFEEYKQLRLLLIGAGEECLLLCDNSKTFWVDNWEGHDIMKGNQ